MKLRTRAALLTTATLMGAGLLAAPSANAASQPVAAKAVTAQADSELSASATDFSCVLKKIDIGPRTCKWNIDVAKGKTLKVELVSASGYKVKADVRDADKKKLSSEKLKAGDGYKLHWTNNASSKRTVSISANATAAVDVKANMRYKVS